MESIGVRKWKVVIISIFLLGTGFLSTVKASKPIRPSLSIEEKIKNAVREKKELKSIQYKVETLVEYDDEKITKKPPDYDDIDWQGKKQDYEIFYHDGKLKFIANIPSGPENSKPVFKQTITIIDGTEYNKTEALDGSMESKVYTRKIGNSLDKRLAKYLQDIFIFPDLSAPIQNPVEKKMNGKDIVEFSQGDFFFQFSIPQKTILKLIYKSKAEAEDIFEFSDFNCINGLYFPGSVIFTQKEKGKLAKKISRKIFNLKINQTDPSIFMAER